MHDTHYMGSGADVCQFPFPSIPSLYHELLTVHQCFYIRADKVQPADATMEIEGLRPSV